MITTYRPVAMPTRPEPSPEWRKEVVLSPTANLTEKKRDTECGPVTEERLDAEHRNSNGHLWETIAVSETFQIAPMRSTGVLETRLAESETKLDEYAHKVDELTYAIDQVVNARVQCEALATSRESAMYLLSLLADKSAIHQDEIAKHVSVPEEWLSLAWLMKSNLVEHTGAFLIITDRGRQIASAVFGH